MLLLDDLMHERFRDLLQSNSGLAAALHYSRTRPPLNALPLFDSLDDAEAAELMQPQARPAREPREPKIKVGTFAARAVACL
jgi:hypothetical protein